MKLGALVVAIVLGFAAGPALAKDHKDQKKRPMKTTQIARFSFGSDEDHVEVAEVGVNAHSAALMEPSDATKKGAWVTLYTMSREELASVPAAARLGTFKTTYLGTGKPAEKPVKRSFFGHEVSGDWLTTKVPRALTIEAYEVPLPDGGALFVGFRRTDTFPAERAEAFFARFAATLKAN